jgi:hypothetical protein
MGRGAANIATFGVAALARKKCKGCGHPMSEHQSATAPAQQVSASQARGAEAESGVQGWWSPQDDGRHRWWNGERWTDYYTNYPNDPNSVGKAMTALAGNPPRWIMQDDGRERWWAGLGWTDDFKTQPELEPAAGARTSSAADEIKKLGELHAAGVLTDEEFAAAKKKLLGI